MEFSFSKEPGLVILNHLSSMLPVGVDIQVYFCNKTGDIFKSEYKNGKTETHEINDDNELSQVFDIRKQRKNPYSWELSREQLDFIKSAGKRNIQFSLQNENEHLMLSMRYNSIFDKNNDVVFLSFREDMSFFGIEGGHIKMNTENKTIIANLLYKSSVSILQVAQEDYDSLKKFTSKTQTTISNVKQYKDKLKQLREDHHKNIVSIAQSFIQNLSKKYCVEFIFTDECINALKDFSSNLPRLQDIVENAALYAYNLNSFRKKGTVTIEEEYLELGQSDISARTETARNVRTSYKLNRKERAEIMLNKIELAVKRVMANKDRVTGINVGKAFETPITAAAITDYLKKHFDEINEILEENPSRFPEARANFKPLQNVIPLSNRVKSA